MAAVGMRSGGRSHGRGSPTPRRHGGALTRADDFSAVLTASRQGDASALSRAFEAAYDELRRVARRQLRRLRPGQTLTTTALVHEAYVKLVQSQVDPQDTVHFLALAARAMRQILVDYARQRGSLKRGGDRRPTTFDGQSIPQETIAEE